MLDSRLYGIPLDKALAYRTGQIKLYGAILKDVNTGRIVGHVQETGILQKAVSAALSSGGSPVSFLTNIAEVVQNEQIKGKLEALEAMMGTQHILQVATLASSVIGIGVTAISTAILIQRIEGVRAEIGNLAGRIDGLAKELDAKQLRRDMADLRTALERLESLERRRDAASVARAVEDDLPKLNGRFAADLSHASTAPTLDLEVIATLTASFSLSGTARTNALLWSEELSEARAATLAQARAFEALSQALPTDLLIERGGEGARGEALAMSLRELRARAASQPAVVGWIQDQGLSGRQYLASAETRDDAPLLFCAHAA